MEPLQNIRSHAYPPGGSLSTEDTSVLRRDLLAWFDANGRSLPWRKNPSLYGIWVSEVMLQQTTVATVGAYWQRFMTKFPTVNDLAAAPLDEVLACWSGLGYYRRARNLHQTAQLVVRERSGRWPASSHEWSAMPGIGEYASGAIASIALREKVPAVDANAKRVLQRWFLDGPDLRPGLKPKVLREVAADLVDPARPGDWNQAVMELGALICRPQEPQCRACPVARFCRAGRSGRVAAVPNSRRRPVVQKVMVGQLLICREDQVLLWPQDKIPLVINPAGRRLVRSDFSRLHRGLWGLPSTPWYLQSPTGRRGLWLKPHIWSDWWQNLLAEAGQRGQQFPAEFRGRFKHCITRFQLEVEVTILSVPSGDFPGPNFLTEQDPLSPKGPEGQDWIPDPKANLFSARFFSQKVEKLPISSLVQKSMALV